MRINVRVTPNSRREKFEKVGESEFSAALKERPARNEANDRAQILVARHFNVPLTSVRLIRGMRAKKKVFEVVH